MVWTGSALPVTGCQKKTKEAEDRSDSSSHLTIGAHVSCCNCPCREDCERQYVPTAQQQQQQRRRGLCKQVCGVATQHERSRTRKDEWSEKHLATLWTTNMMSRTKTQTKKTCGSRMTPAETHFRCRSVQGSRPNRCESCTDAARGSVIQTRHLLEEEDEESARPESDIVQCDVACGVVVACWRSGE